MICRFSGNPDQPRDEAAIELVVEDLPFDTDEVTVEHYRIDDAHSNAHAEWVAQGSPQRPTAEQASAIRAKEQLERAEPSSVERLEGKTYRMQMTLPPCSVSLIVLRGRE